MNWTSVCPHCGKPFNSRESKADSIGMLRFHIERKHQEEDAEN